MSTLEKSFFETHNPRSVPTPATVPQREKTRKSAIRLTTLLVFGLMLDYGGGFGIKNLVGWLALLWVLLHPHNYRIFHRQRFSLLLFLGLPCLLGILHLLLWSSDPAARTSVGTYGVEFYQRTSSALLILLLPLVYAAGSKAIIRPIVIGFRILSVVLILIFGLHYLGVINLDDYVSIAQARKIGFVGLDPRLPGVTASQRPVLSPRIAFVIPLALAFELASSVPGALLLFLSLLVVGSRGLLIGAVLLILLWIWIAFQKRRGRAIMLRLAPLVALLALIVLSSQAVQYRLDAVILSRLGKSLQGKDLSSLIRVGHVEGYVEMVQEEPWTALIGAGPLGSFRNTVTGYRVSITEMSILNLALWFGVPYALLYTLSLYLAAWRLWRLRRKPGFEKRDMALVIGAAVFWLVGNFNPMMVSPFGMIAYMLLVVRRAELKGLGHAHNPARKSPLESIDGEVLA